MISTANIYSSDSGEAMLLPSQILLTDVIILPDITQHHITGQQHCNASNTTLLDVDVLVEKSVMA